MIAVDLEQRSRLGVVWHQAGDEIDDLLLWRLALAIRFALSAPCHAADLADRRAFVTKASGFCGQHVNQAPFNAAMCFFPRRNEQGGKNRLLESRFDILSQSLLVF